MERTLRPNDEPSAGGGAAAPEAAAAPDAPDAAALFRALDMSRASERFTDQADDPRQPVERAEEAASAGLRRRSDGSTRKGAE